MSQAAATPYLSPEEYLAFERDSEVRHEYLDGEIFEVLSESTERYDRGAKFGYYRALPSLVDYVLVSQEEALVEHFRRAEDGSWVLRTFSSGELLALESLACSIAIDEIYEKVLGPPTLV